MPKPQLTILIDQLASAITDAIGLKGDEHFNKTLAIEQALKALIGKIAPDVNPDETDPRT